MRPRVSRIFAAITTLVLIAVSIAAATAGTSIARDSGSDAVAPPRLGAATASRTPIPRPIYKGLTIEQIARDPALLQEVLARGDHTGMGGVREAANGQVDPLVESGDTDTACPNGEECP